ncbi:hypothetical protein Q5P01_006742 [Channa striata]|uniref:Uncharacterized protein n=1 Tax=Channa striata TaxID=64152 RepID=A0AA88NDG1_CHASR|nr:hypothetical protein Q5P01_006742 [Channa striata]
MWLQAATGFHPVPAKVDSVDSRDLVKKKMQLVMEELIFTNSWAVENQRNGTGSARNYGTSSSVLGNTAEGAEGNAGGEASDDSITVVQIGQNGEYLGTARLPAQAEGTCYTAPIGSADDLTADDSSAETASAVHQPTVQYVSVTSSPLDHSYSLTTGTTSAELLRKLNEQRDIIALMEVKMKEMKATIRDLRVAEAKLQEEVRERDRLLYGNSVALGVRKKI